MTDNFVAEIPWKAIVKSTAAFAVSATALCVVGVAHDRNQKREAERFRWTDKNRWE